MNRSTVSLLLLVTLFTIGSPTPALGEWRDACQNVWLGGAQADCHSSGSQLRHYMTSAEGSLYAYRLTQDCAGVGDVGTCDSPRACTTATATGTLYSVSRRPLATPGAAFVPFAVVCLTAGEEGEFDVISWRRVWEVMRRLEWPEAELVVQPVGGRTLVNFETNLSIRPRPRLGCRRFGCWVGRWRSRRPRSPTPGIGVMAVRRW